MRTIRWGDNDRYFGPFTWSVSDTYKRIAIELHSGGHGDSDDGPPSLRISIWKWTLIMVLPFMIPPQRTKIFVPEWRGTDTERRLGRDWYWRVEPREYGLSYLDGFLIVYYGIQPCDSSRDQTWCWHLPWTQWRHVRLSFYGRDSEEVGSIFDADYRLARRGLGGDQFKRHRELEAAVPKVCFIFKDFDGEQLIATTYIEEREWWFGQGWFKWLAWLRPAKIRRYLEISFSGETGRRKGSWKGGTLGHSIDMQWNGARWDDTHYSAFVRYCREHEMEFVGWADPQ